MSTPFTDKHGRSLTSQEFSQKLQNRIAAIWLEFVTGFLWWFVGEVPIHHVRRFFYRLAGMKIGKGSSIHMRVRIYNPRNITIGEDSIIGERVVLDGRAKLTIGDHVDIATGAMIFNSHHDVHSEDFHPIEMENSVADYVFIGPNVIILPGVQVGKGAVIGAGAVVTKNVEPMSIMGGVPAKEIGKRQVSELKYKLGRARWFQ
jgi:acetyltransferase-like isoleucine patch superfamily enzyme